MVNLMIMLFSDRKNKCETEIKEILQNYGAQYISDKFISGGNTNFTILSVYKKCEIQIEKGIAVFLTNTERFLNQKLPVGIIGICEENNNNALEILRQNKVSAICCGLGSKNSITLSSIGSDYLYTCLQRTIQSNNGKIIEQGEFKIKLNKDYLPFSVMASAATLLLEGIIPNEF